MHVFGTDTKDVRFVPLSKLLPEEPKFTVAGVSPHAGVGNRRLSCTRQEFEISEAIDLLIRSGHTIDAVELDGWRIGVGSPDDRDEAENRLQRADQPVPEQ